MKARLFTLPVLLAISFSYEPCLPSSIKKQADQPKQGDVVYEVTTIVPKIEEAPLTVQGTGIFRISDQLTVKSPLSGTIDKVFFNEGDTVQVGDVLCQLKSDDLVSQVEKKQAEQKEMEAILELHQKGGGQTTAPPHEDNENIFLDEEGHPTKETGKYGENDAIVNSPPSTPIATAPKNEPPPVIDYAAQIKVDEAKIERIRQELETLINKQLLLSVKAGIAGMIQKRFVTDGTQIYEGDVLFEIIQVNPVTLVAKIPAQTSSYIDKLSKASVHPKNAEDLEAQSSLFYISPIIDTATKTLEVHLHVPNDRGLIRAGQEGEVKIITRKMNKVFLIPPQALLKEGNKNYIFIVTGPKAEKVEVETGPEKSPQEITIRANIRADEAIILAPRPELKDGSFVKSGQT
ncbi:MAG TPA: hypothetical protein DDW49_02930 [Deltaproteobacteria bacterium]|nr:MAG: hypothetical protein A2048_05235 [Deltaproteobacteria bacterium GWA2_45_12]HBF12334.1 hypothetical protein [Deltaproteobacteria bacterium]